MDPIQNETPRCLSDLRATRVPDDDELILKIVCRACGESGFSFNEVSHGDAPIGIIFHCVKCGAEDEAFDGIKHGYDGELGHTDHLEGPRSVHELVWADGSSPRVEGLFALFTFNIDVSELQEISSETNVRPVDLFDWFHLSTRTPEGRYETIWDYECS